MRENKRRKENNLGGALKGARGHPHGRNLRMTGIVQVTMVFVFLLSAIPYTPSAQAQPTWSPEDVIAGAGPGLSIALDRWDSSHISFYSDDYSSVMYAYKPFGGSIWVTYTIETGSEPSSNTLGIVTSIAIDEKDVIHISYRYKQSDITTLKYVNFPLEDIPYLDREDYEWDISVVESVTGDDDVGQFSSIAIDSSYVLHIAYYRSLSTGSELIYAPKQPDSDWEKEVVPLPDNEDSDNYGLYVSLDLDNNNDPHMSYYDAGRGKLKYAKKEGEIWIKHTVDESSANVGLSSSLAVEDGSNIHIAYIDGTNLVLKYVYINDLDSTGTWLFKTVQAVISNLQETNSMSVSIALLLGNVPCISYHNSIEEVVRFAIKDDNHPDGWVISKVFDFINNQNDNLYSSLTIDKWNSPYIAFFHTGKGLMFATRNEIHFRVTVDNPQNGYFDIKIYAGTGSDKVFTNPQRYYYTDESIADNIVDSLIDDDKVIQITGNLRSGHDEGLVIETAFLNGEKISYSIQVTRYGGQRGIVLLIDSSGSMSSSHTGDWWNIPYDEQRIYFAKQAAQSFIQLLNNHDYFRGYTSGGIATFPRHDYEGNWFCDGDFSVVDIGIINQAQFQALDEALDSEDETKLPVGGKTPLLYGMEKAILMLRNGDNIGPEKTIILLSDGYHNCPSREDPYESDEVNRIFGLLDNGDPIKVYTIGFGSPGDDDHKLLERFAQDTNGAFYDVTGDYFDPSWDANTALQATYKSILAHWLGLQSVLDPFDSIRSNEVETHEVKLNEYDRKVSFFISWSSSDSGRLDMTVISSDDKPVPLSRPEISFHEGETYQILTVGERFMQLPGKVGVTPWKLEINASNLTKGQEIKYQYSVISDSILKMNAEVQAPEAAIGSNLTINVKITEAGIPVTGLTNVRVNVTRPEDGIGNWYADHAVTLKELEKIPGNIGYDNLSSRFRKAAYLIEERNVSFPGRINAGTLQLFDDGTHGDSIANDGNYTNIFADTPTEGAYSFHIYVSGSTMGRNYFERETEIQKYIRPKFSSEHSHGEVESVEKGDRIHKIRVTFTPMDALGNHLGPGYAGDISINVTWGKEVSELIDNIDGTYSQEFEVPIDVAAEAEITVQFGGVPKLVSWEDPPEPDDCESLQRTIYFLMSLLIIMVILILVLLVKLRRKS